MNKWVVAFLILILIVVVYFAGSRILKQELRMTQEQAVSFATDELRFAYPNSTIEIYGTENISTVAGENSWKIEAKVIYGRNTICPNLTLMELRYPRFGFVPRERIITESCRVLGCRNIPGCPIAYPEEAILMPLDPDRNQDLQPDLSRFIDSAGGSSNISASADLRTEYLTPSNASYSDVWVVSYGSTGLNQSLEIVLNRTGGTALEHYLLNKSQ